MDKFSFKNYPPQILVLLICITVALKFGLHKIGNIVFKQQTLLSWTDLIYIALSGGSVIALMRLVNRKAMWKWLLKLLNLHDVRGIYEGHIISSFHNENDPALSNIKRYAKVKIIQNINGLHVSGDYYSDQDMKDLTSSFTSSNEEIKKLPDGNFQLYYFFSSKGDQFHRDHTKYGLNNHEGICNLTFHTDQETMEGYYFNRERSSHGKVLFKRIS